MRRDILELDTTLSRVLPAAPDLGDIEAMRLLLSGGSVIDWHKAAFADHQSVDRHLRLHRLDLTDPVDRRRLRYVFGEAVSYVETYLHLRVPPELREVADVRDVFLWASDTRGFRRRQVLCCTILKLMHVMQHLEAADLRLRASISEARLLDLAHADIARAADAMRHDGVPLAAFYGSKKTRMSVVSKLLSKREDVAARIFDKLRYRVVVPTRHDLPHRHLFPFNQVVPGQSHNNLIDPEALAVLLAPGLADGLQAIPDGARRAPLNLYSGATFRMINTVVDLPVVIPEDARPDGRDHERGKVVYVTVEFQIVDAVTARDNERGDNAHDRYKLRQHEVVQRRLTRGAYVPDRQDE
jgi:uncharacterized protein (TIGR04552 family)